MSCNIILVVCVFMLCVSQTNSFWTKASQQTCSNTLEARLQEETRSVSQQQPIPEVWQDVYKYLHLDSKHPSVIVWALVCLTILFIIWQLHADPSSFIRYVRTILFIFFLMSIPWNWWHLYQVEKARRMPVLLAQMPKSCRLDQLSSLERAWEAVKSGLRFGPTDCEEWHEKMWVDPIWEVPPTKAVAVTITKFIFEPINHIGKSFNLIIKGAMDDMPYFWSLPTYVFLMLFISLILIGILALIVMTCMMSFGYRINFGLFGISPGKDSKSKEAKLQKRLKELEALVQKLESQNKQLIDTNHCLTQAITMQGSDSTDQKKALQGKTMDSIEVQKYKERNKQLQDVVS